MESAIKPIAYILTKKENGNYVCGILTYYSNQRKAIADWSKQEYKTRRECIDVLLRYSNAGREFIPIAPTPKTLRRILQKYPTLDIDLYEVYGPYFRHFDTREN